MIIDGYSAEDINNNAMKNMNQYILKRNSELIDRKEFDNYSLTTKLSALRHKGIITDNDYKKLRGALNLEKAIKDIKAEIQEEISLPNHTWFRGGMEYCIDIIEKHIGDKE